MKNKIEKGDILFFDTLSDSNCNQLKNFIFFLKNIDKSSKVQFSYLDEDGSLISNISLKDNLILEATTSLCDKKLQNKLDSFMDESNNFGLKKLYNSIENINLITKESTKETIKIVALIKALIKNCKYYLINLPEKHLSNDNLTNAIAAITHKAKKEDKIIFLSTENQEIWAEYSNKVVRKTPFEEFKIINIANESSEEASLSFFGNYFEDEKEVA